MAASSQRRRQRRLPPAPPRPPGPRCVDALEDAYAVLARNPSIGTPRYAAELDIPGLRTWALPRFPYLICYAERQDRIDVWRVLHGRRDIPAHLADPDPG